MQGAHARAQPGGLNLLQFGQGAGGAVGDAGDGARGGGAQADGHGDRLFVVEEQRRHRGACGEPVAAGGAARGADGVAEVAQPLDVAADRAHADAEPCGQFRSGPLAGGLEQGEQSQETGGGVVHRSRVAAHADMS